MGHHSTAGCTCLYELENRLRRTKHCFVACHAQLQILKEREERSKKSKQDVQDKNREEI